MLEILVSSVDSADGVSVLCEVDLRHRHDGGRRSEHMYRHVERGDGVGKLNEVSGIAVEHDLLEGLCTLAALDELYHSEQVIVNRADNVVRRIVVVSGVDVEVTREYDLVILVKVHVKESLIDLDKQHGHSLSHLGGIDNKARYGVVGDVYRLEGKTDVGEQPYIAVYQALRAGSRNDLDELVLLLVLGFTGDGVGDIELIGNAHIRLDHRLDSGGVLDALGLGEHHLLVNDGAGGDGHDSVLLRDALGLDDVVQFSGNHRHIGYVSVGNHAEGELTHIRVLYPDLAAAV